MKKQIINQSNGKIASYIEGVRVTSMRDERDNRVHLAKETILVCCAIDNYRRITILEGRIRRIRQRIFAFENAGANLDKLKAELLIQRGRFLWFDGEAFERAVKQVNR